MKPLSWEHLRQHRVFVERHLVGERTTDTRSAPWASI